MILRYVTSVIRFCKFKKQKRSGIVCSEEKNISKLYSNTGGELRRISQPEELFFLRNIEWELKKDGLGSFYGKDEELIGLRELLIRASLFS